MNQTSDSNLVWQAGFQKKLMLIAATLLAFLLCVGAGCADDTKAVPDVTNMTKDDAERVIQDNGFTVGNETVEQSESVEAGKVISQSPGAGDKQKPGTSINLAISSGMVKEVHVPNVIGMTQTQAEDAIMAASLIPRPENPVYNSSATPGKVFKQSVPPDTVVVDGTSVAFTVALGSETAEVPNVVGQTGEKAAQTLANAAFNVDVVEQYDANVASGLVVSQNPNAQTQVVKGTTVTINVSKGPAPASKIAVPDMMTYTLPQAQLALNSAGLVLNPSGDMNGTVTAQSPKAGTQVDKGTSVSVTFEPIVKDSDQPTNAGQP